MTLQIVILAAGQGKRMHSSRPKVLHKIGGKPLLAHVLDVAREVTEETLPIVIYGHQGEEIQAALTHYAVQWIAQKEQLGTGHALQQALPAITPDATVLVLYGDVPLVSAHTLRELVHTTTQKTGGREAFGIVAAQLSDPTGYGRIKRDYDRNIVGIVEERDADSTEKHITEVNTGIYCIAATHLHKWLPRLTNHNQQQEYYLTDLIAYAVADHIPIHTVQPKNTQEILGVNDCVQLAQLERAYQYAQAEKFMQHGVTFYDPHRFDLRGELQVGRDVTIDVNVIIEGRVVIGDHCVIGPHVLLRNTTVAPHSEIKAFSVVDGAEIGEETTIGPFARLRPGTVLAQHVHIGNFVEIKNSTVSKNSKINHLSYIGDSDIGARVNVGAGTITCNYDGVNKHKTTIGDDVFIGSDTQLVAPVVVGEGATIAAGSTIVKDVAPHALTLTQVLHQRVVEGWGTPK